MQRALPSRLAALAQSFRRDYPVHSHHMSRIVKLAAHVEVVDQECVELVAVAVPQVHGSRVLAQNVRYDSGQVLVGM